jgi:hypothetical protein
MAAGVVFGPLDDQMRNSAWIASAPVNASPTNRLRVNRCAYLVGSFCV